VNLRIALFTVALLAASLSGARATIVQVLLKDGSRIEGSARFDSVVFRVNGKDQRISLSRILSIHSADAATPQEEARISSDLAAISGADVKSREAAAARLTDLGLAAMTPLLQTFKDRDFRQPDPAYRLFARLVPGYADHVDRSLDLARLRDGETRRGSLAGSALHIAHADGRDQAVAISDIRRLAVRQKEVTRKMEVHSLLHSTQIEFADSGIELTSDSRLDSESVGYVRLDYDKDGWSSDPDGLKKPGPNYRTNLVDGFPFGALIGRIGAGGQRWMLGKSFHKSGMEPGRLYLAVNDNPHWQNNIGSFRASLRATNAYDLGDPQ
jgi:hypothetical protein